MVTNKTMGNRFEKEFCEILFQNGFWVHNMAQTSSGQPADVIAVRNEFASLIDCKVCTHNRFPLSRIEDNQHLAMQIWKERGNGDGWFALLLADNEIYMIPYFHMQSIAKEKSSIGAEDIKAIGTPIARWVKQCG